MEAEVMHVIVTRILHTRKHVQVCFKTKCNGDSSFSKFIIKYLLEI